jgi:site-specific DNA-methyltransferase (adenine-specific)
MQFLQGDCLEVMKTLPCKSVDCFVCDLPYGCLTGGGGKEKAKRKKAGSRDHIAGCSWDIKLNLDLFWEQIKRLAKDDHTPVLMFCTTKFGVDLINSNPSWFRYDMVWSKSNAVGFLCANKMPMRSHELIYVFAKKGAYYTRIDEVGCPKSVIEVANKKGKGNHPTQKPAELYEWLLKRYCPPGGTILDPTAGSFTSCIVAKSLGLQSIGIEKDEGFYTKALTLL